MKDLLHPGTVRNVISIKSYLFVNPGYKLPVPTNGGGFCILHTQLKLFITDVKAIQLSTHQSTSKSFQPYEQTRTKTFACVKLVTTFLTFQDP